MQGNNWISWIFNLLGILGVVAGLWLARGVLPDLLSWLESEDRKDLLTHRATKIILWLALGSLFSLPFFDILDALAGLASYFLVPANEFALFMGMISTMVFLGVHIILKVIVYGVILYFAMDYIVTPGRFTQFTRTLVVLSLAGLVYRSFEMIINVVSTFQFPGVNLQPGGLSAQNLPLVFIGLAFIAVILVVLNRFLPDPSTDTKH
jgi:hypothetical protein